MHQDLFNDSVATQYFQQKIKNQIPIKKSQILPSMISNNIYNNLRHFDKDIIVQIGNGKT